jgi:endoglucanase
MSARWLKTKNCTATSSLRNELNMLIKHSLVIAVLVFLGVTQAHADAGFYVDPDSSPALWVRAHQADPRAPRIAEAIANVPMARWFGNWSGDVHKAVKRFVDKANATNREPILVAYNIPHRDCGGASAGGVGDASAYQVWIDSFSRGLSNRRAIVIVEPDSTAQLDCFKTDGERDERLGLLRYAVSRFRLNAPAADVYLDGGNAHWVPAATMAARLNAAGLSEAKGFALNVSNFYTTEESAAYANSVNAALGAQFGYSKPFVVDTSRNGKGSDGQWCNPPGRMIGARSSGASGTMLPVWIKVPGNSDGPCGSAPTSPAGAFSPELAVRLIDGD